MSQPGPAWWWCTAPAPGAIAVACVSGSNKQLDCVARALTGAAAPQPTHIAWRTLGRPASFDDGVIARVTHDAMLLMPHGGAQIAVQLQRALHAAGCTHVPGGDASSQSASATFPEAHDNLEAAVLETLSRAASPRAVDLLLAQPALWRAHALRTVRTAPTARTAQQLHRDRVLRRLITPPRVVMTGAANAGKSTLLNALAGHAVAVVHDTPGTTRDAVAARIDLDGLVVDWFDTPGVRAMPDAPEAEAAAMAATMLAHADLVVQLSAPGLGWHSLAPLPEQHIRVMNKCDLAAANDTPHPLRISATRGDGVAEFVRAVREALVPTAMMDAPEPWIFSHRVASATLAPA